MPPRMQRIVANYLLPALLLTSFKACRSANVQTSESTTQQPAQEQVDYSQCTHRPLWEYNEDGSVKQYLGCN